MTTIPGTGSGREPAKRCRVPRWLHGGSKVDFDGLGGPARAPGGVTAQAWRPSGCGGRDRRSIVPTSGRSFRPNRSCSCFARGPAGNSAAVTGPARILPLPPLGAPPQVGSHGIPARYAAASFDSPAGKPTRRNPEERRRHAPARQGVSWRRRCSRPRCRAAGGKRRAAFTLRQAHRNREVASGWRKAAGAGCSGAWGEERMDSSNRGRRWPQGYCGAFQTMSWTFTGLGISFCS